MIRLRLALDLTGVCGAARRDADHGASAHGAGLDGAWRAALAELTAATPDAEVAVLADPGELAALAAIPSRPGSLRLCPAQPLPTAVAGADDAAAVRAHPRSGVRQAVRLLRDGEVDAVICTAPLRAVAAGAAFALRLLPGLAAPVPAWLLPTDTGPLVLIAPAGAGDRPAVPRPGECGHGAAVAAAALAALSAAAPAGRQTPPAPAVGVLGAGGLTGAALVAGGGPPGAVTSLPVALLLLSVLAAVGREPGPGLVLGVDGLVAWLDPASRPETLLPAATALLVAGLRAGLVVEQRRRLEQLVAARRGSAGLDRVGP